MKALSIRQPWAWAILHAGKDIENRDWRYAPKFRGEFYIHASSGLTIDEYYDNRGFIHTIDPDLNVPEYDRLPLGGIVGKAFLIDVIRTSRSPWFVGPFGFVLKDAQPLPFMPWKGALGFFDVPEQLNLI
jgi:hypothetical protein